MLKVKRNGQQFTATIGNGFIGGNATGSSPMDALHILSRTIAFSVYKPYIQEIINRVNNWQISYADLSIGINTGTIVL